MAGRTSPSSSSTSARTSSSAQSGDIVSNGYQITVGGKKDQAGGGTSLSSPLWLGMWTRIQAAPPARAHRWSTQSTTRPMTTRGRRLEHGQPRLRQRVVLVAQRKHAAGDDDHQEPLCAPATGEPGRRV